MKRIIGLIVCLVLLVSAISQPVLASQKAREAIFLNGLPIGVYAYEQDGTLYVPLRAISEALGYTVAWASSDRTITLTKGSESIKLGFNLNPFSNGDHTFYSEPPILVDGRSYMSSEFMSTNLPIRIDRDEVGAKIDITPVTPNTITIQTITEASDTDILDLDIQYPQISGLKDQTVADKINGILKQAAATSKETGNKNAQELASFMKEIGDSGIRKCGTYFNYQVHYNQMDRLSVVLTDYQYAGGAHGSTLQTSYTFDLKTGNSLSLQDLFKSGADYKSVINKEVVKGLADRMLTEGLFEPFKSILPDQGYYLSNSGVVVYFQQYEILPYAAGIQAFTTPYSSFENLLK